jgi:hypothetical protein
MENHTNKIIKEDVLMPINAIMKKIAEPAAKIIAENGLDPTMVNRLEIATGYLKEFFLSVHVEFVQELDPKVLASLRLYLRVFADDQYEMACVFLMEAIIKIAAGKRCIDPLLAPYWSKISPVQYFKDNTPIY